MNAYVQFSLSRVSNSYCLNHLKTNWSNGLEGSDGDGDVANDGGSDGEGDAAAAVATAVADAAAGEDDAVAGAGDVAEAVATAGHQVMAH